MKKRQTIWMALAATALLVACSSTTVVVGPSPAPSVAPTPSPGPTAVPSAPDGPLDYKAIAGYQLVQGSVELTPIEKDNEIKFSTVLKSQAELAKYLTPVAGTTPEAVDFSKHYVLLTVKVTGAYAYQAQITSLNMSGGDLLADYRYTINYHSDQMLNDFIRPIITVTRFDRLTYGQLKVTPQAMVTGSPSPSPAKP